VCGHVRPLAALLLGVSFAWLASGAAGARAPAELSFYPQAGIHWQDLYTVTSAALSDVVRAGIAAPGERLACSVTPSDGRVDGPVARTAAVLR
jgi:hypothetical protein